MKKQLNTRNKEYVNAKSQIDEFDFKPEVKSEADGRIIADPFGSWTGVPIDSVFDQPVQDVDDL